MKDFMFWTPIAIVLVAVAYITGSFWAWTFAIVVCLFAYVAAHEALTTGSEPARPSTLEDVNSELRYLYEELEKCYTNIEFETAEEYRDRKRIQGEIADMMRIKGSIKASLRN